MREHVTRQFGVLKTTAVGGLFFLLPLAVIGFLLGPVVPTVLWVASFVRDTLGIDTVYGYGLIVLIVVGVFLVLCFAAGLFARLKYGRQLSRLAEKAILFVFPRYAVYKYQLAEGVGDADLDDRATPVLVPFAGVTRLGLEIERSEDGVATVYLPGSPDAWSGQVCFVSATQLTEVEADFGELMATFEKLGRGAVGLVGMNADSLEPET
ncbi:MAG: hypothetical protein AAF532_05750 [Planctomycetota bacterium]